MQGFVVFWPPQLRRLAQTLRVTAPAHSALPTDRDLVACMESNGIRSVFTVPCTVTAGWHHQVLERSQAGFLSLVPTTHEGNLAGMAAGSWLATGRAALIHLQNCGLPNLGDGVLTFAQPQVFAIPMAVLVTFRGASSRDGSEPHREVGKRTDALVEAIFGPEARVRGDRMGQQPVLHELALTLRHAQAGGLAVLKLSPHAFLATAIHGQLAGPAVSADPLALVENLCQRQELGGGAWWGSQALMREEAITAIRARHPGAAVLFCNGYTARAAQAMADRACDFFNVGYMGGTLAIGWALARERPTLEVVVVDGDQNAQMGTMKDHLLQAYPPNLHWYILDNGMGESVGGAPSLPLSPLYRVLARVIPIRPQDGPFPYPRVGHGPCPPGGGLPELARRFRQWIERHPSPASQEHPPSPHP
jgi:sulfopyruvate decarboxylase TPP-binding subunit